MGVNPRAAPSPPARFDQRKRAACEEAALAGEVRGERRGPWGGEEAARRSRVGMSWGGTFTGEEMAFGRTSCGPPAGRGILRTIETGPPVSMAASPSLLELLLLDSLPDSSESLLEEELELELFGLNIDTPAPLPPPPLPPPPPAFPPLSFPVVPLLPV